MSKQNIISIIVVVRNEVITIAKTLKNIIDQDFKDFELIVIDGASTDGTIDIIQSFNEDINIFISEKDKNLYEAMNKGVDLASSEWVLFMNSNDFFYDKNTLAYLNNKIRGNEGKSVFIGNSLIKYPNYDIEILASKNPLQFVHQATLYKKKLHETYGSYLVDKTITISDYIFFNQVPADEIQIMDQIISINTSGGISSAADSLFQKVSYDYSSKKISRIKFILILMFYDYYKFCKNFYLNFKSLLIKK